MTSYRSWVDRLLDGFRGEPDAIVVRDASRSLDLEDAACARTDVVYAVALPGEAGTFGVLALRSRGSWVEADEVREHLRRLVEPASAVGPVVVVDHLPVTEQGKPDRTIVFELLRP